VAANVKRLRESQRLTFTELAAILEGLGRTIPTLGLRHIEAEKRRVDADDLVALAVALGVSPITLLMPAAESPQDQVRLLDMEVRAAALFDWLRVRRAIPAITGRGHFEFLSRSMPPWAFEQMERDALEMIARERQRIEPWLSEDADDGDD